LYTHGPSHTKPLTSTLWITLSISRAHSRVLLKSLCHSVPFFRVHHFRVAYQACLSPIVANIPASQLIDNIDLHAVELHSNIYRPSLQLIGAPWLNSHKHELLTRTTLASITNLGGARLGSTGNNMRKKKRCQDSLVNQHLRALLKPTV